MSANYHVIEAKLGFAAIAWNEAGVWRFNLPGPKESAANRFGGVTPAEPPPHIAAIVDQAERYFAGARMDFDATGLDLSIVEPLRRAIYDALRKVRFGETVTYGELAKRAGA